MGLCYFQKNLHFFAYSKLLKIEILQKVDNCRFRIYSFISPAIYVYGDTWAFLVRKTEPFKKSQ